jgi:hypothetical protein
VSFLWMSGIVRSYLWRQLGMILGNPVLNALTEGVGLLQKLAGFCLRRHIGHVVVHQVAFAATDVEVIGSF